MDADRASRLDFTSEHFDATLVLNTNDVQIPFPDAETFETVSDYHKIVEKKMDPSQLQSAHLKSKRERFDRLKAMTQHSQPPESETPGEDANKVKTKQRSLRNVFTFMEKSVSNGPLGVLYRCMNERVKVKVWTRNYKYVRGICTGFIEAFDKHWNLALSDVDESFVKYNKTKSPATADAVQVSEKDDNKTVSNTEGETSLNWECAQIGSVCVKRTRQLQTFQRHVNKLFIRGENIVIIAVVT